MFAVQRVATPNYHLAHACTELPCRLIAALKSSNLSCCGWHFGLFPTRKSSRWDSSLLTYMHSPVETLPFRLGGIVLEVPPFACIFTLRTLCAASRAMCVSLPRSTAPSVQHF
jgi:hypothetical protein